MVSHTAKTLVWVLTTVALVSSAPQRSVRSLEPPGYQPPCNCNHDTNAPPSGEYIPPTAQENGISEQNVTPEHTEKEYLPPLEVAPATPRNAAPDTSETPEQIEEIKDVPAADNEYLPPASATQQPTEQDVPIDVRLDNGNSQSEAVAEGQSKTVSACVEGNCVEKQVESEPKGYDYPKPAAPFQLPTVEIARSVEEELPNESGCNTCSSSAAGTIEQKSKREAGKISSVSTDPSSGPVRITTLPFLVAREARGQRAEIDDLTRNRREAPRQGSAQTLPAKIGTAQTLPAKIGTAQTLPAKIGTAQTLPAKHRRDTKKTTYPAQKKDEPKAQTLPAKTGTAQTLPGKH